ncbi:MAG: FAD-dependent oxidoreductase, partial [Chloroflexota bacterium]|nr:FAD-dependent oxidoreductase [Chloroflexota bacterium]
MSEYDVVVVGLGAMGSAAAYQLARRGQRVLGLDAFEPGHTFGSSHGETRIIRLAYYEHPSYVPLLRRAYALWDQLEHESGERLRYQTGGLFIGAADGEIVTGCLRSAQQHQLAHELLDAREIRRRFPVFEPRDDEAGVFEHVAGVLFPERCIAAYLKLANRRG